MIEIVEGFDTSRWEGKLNPTKAFTAGAKFLYAKTSEYVVDPKFHETWDSFKGIMPRGGFHYLNWNVPWLTQARLFCDLLEPDPGELPPALDLEMWPFAGMKATDVSLATLGFLKYVEARMHRLPILYVGYYYWNSWGSNDPIYNHFPLWLPWYAPIWYIKLRTGGGTGAPRPWKNWLFWQDTDHADGLKYGCQSLEVDHNIFNGSSADLARLAGGFPPATPIQPQGTTYQVKPGYNANIHMAPNLGSLVVRIAWSGTVLTLKTTDIVNGYAQLTDGNWVTFSFLKPV